MMRAKKLLVVAVGLALMQSQMVSAQDAAAPAPPAKPDEGKAVLFDAVIVTATKREESIYQVPVAISAFSAETIERQGIADLTDIGKFVPNMNVTGFSAGHTSSVNPFIRGIGLQDHLITTDPGVGVYVDGVYLGRQVGQNWSLANINRVEVLRGPQGTLYGRNSIGGAINIITTQPGEKEEGRASFTLGTRGRVNSDVYMNGKLNDTLSASFTGAYTKRGGIGEFLNLDTNREVGESRDIAGRLAMKWQPHDDFSLLVAVDANDGEGGLRPYTTLIDELPNGALFQAGFRNSDLAANPFDNNTGQADQATTTNSARGVAVTAEYIIDDNLSAKLIFSDRHSEYEAGLDDDSLFENFLTFPEVGEADQTSVELQFSGTYERWDFITGLYYFEEDGFARQDDTVFTFFPGNDLLTQDTESKAVYANVGFHVSDDLRVSGGLRYTEDDKKAGFNINDSLIDAKNQRDWNQVSWEVNATYDISEYMSTYATIQNGYQSGQFPPRPFCLFGFLDFTQPGNVATPNCFEANDNVTAINYEIGLKGEPFSFLSMSLAVFLTDYKDLPYQVSTTAGAGFDTRNIIVDQQSIGVEWESTLWLNDDFSVHATAGYIDADVDDPVAVAPLTPKLTASLSPEYTWRMGDNGNLSFRADYSYRDGMNGEPTADPGRFTRIKSRSLTNLNVTYVPEGAGWTMALYGTNIFDKRYDNARLNTGDYVLQILSNDASEFGVRFTKYFGR
ncbi:MAG: TonB-dependent receptor [Gammaproteobacteria bacterium HGW-Gammaproteobacteria-4]|jgi:iron complex outermembrane receptor protein|nr:MAG: TonB-dependent receptor [Gammaproteobacteria bacterium HGW-Gammaproteobacteria-4]